MVVGVMAASMMSIGASSTYIQKKSWSVSYVYGNANMCYSSTKEIYVHGEGYMTYCENIDGSNNRLVHVTSGSVVDYNITTTGFSAVIPYYNTGTNKVTFHLEPEGTTYCMAEGSLGHYDS